MWSPSPANLNFGGSDGADFRAERVAQALRAWRRRRRGARREDDLRARTIRRRARRAGLLLVLVTGLHGPAAGSPGPDRCAEPFGGVRSAEVTYLLATPRGDTVPEPDGATGFGQLAEATRVGGASADRVAAALDRSGTVVLVPWGFDESCRPIAWTGSWRWATAGVEGFYRARLRSRDAWIDGRPTFDVHAAVWEGFPASPWEHPMAAGRARLTAEELFELYDRVPTAADVASRPYGAISDLVTWRREAGERAERYPARTLLRSAFDVAETARVRTASLPFNGTYRVRVQVEQGDTDTLATFLLRTGAVGSAPLRPADDANGPVPTAPRPSPAYAAAAALATDPDRLDELSAPDASGCVRERALRAAASETAGGEAAHAWSAELSILFVASCFADVDILRNLRPVDPPDGEREPSTGMAETETEAETEGVPPLSGAFRQETDGRFTFQQPARLADGTPVRLVGQRIDLAALPAPPPVPGVTSP